MLHITKIKHLNLFDDCTTSRRRKKKAVQKNRTAKEEKLRNKTNTRHETSLPFVVYDFMSQSEERGAR